MQKEIQLTDKTLLVVSVPENSYDIKIKQNSEQSDLWYTQDLAVPNVSNWIDLPLCRWQLLGIYPKLTEEQASSVLEKHKVAKDNYSDFTKTYFNSEWLWTCKTALESFQSLMVRENITGFDKYAILIKSK